MMNEVLLSTWFTYNMAILGLPRWLSGKEPTCQCRRHKSDPWVGKSPWRRRWQLTLVCLPGKFHGQRSLAGCSSWSHKRVGHDLVTKQQQHCLSEVAVRQRSQRRHWEPISLGLAHWVLWARMANSVCVCVCVCVCRGGWGIGVGLCRG